MRAFDRSKTIIVRIDADTELRFRFLTVGDEEFLASLLQEDPAPRDFALRVLGNQLLETSPTNPDDLGDEALARAAHCWADKDSSVEKLAGEPGLSLQDFKKLIAAHVDETRRTMEEFAQQIYPHIEQHLEEFRRAATAFSPAVLREIEQFVWPPDHVSRAIREAITIPTEQLAALGRTLSTDAMRSAVLAVEEQAKLIREFAAAASRQLEEISRSMTVAISSLDLVRNLPSPQEIIQVWQAHKLAVDNGEKTLEEEGFSFAKSIIGVDLVVALAGIPEQVRGAHMTNRLLAFTKRRAFGEALEDRINCSDVARRRWAIIERAYAAHTSRNYVLSVPCLFTQVEGLFTDSMIVNDLAEIRSGRVYALDSAGNPRLDRNGRPIALIGLGSKTQHSPYQNHATLREVGGALVQALTGKRNGVLHGSDTAYGRAKLSTQLMLLVFILATEIVAFEQATVSP